MGYHIFRGEGTSEKSYLISIPLADNMDGPCALALAEAAAELTKRGYNFGFQMLQGNCHVDDARNVLSARFLRSNYDYLVFVDSDLIFGPEVLIDLFECPHDIDLVGATYPYKNDSGDYPIQIEGSADADEKTGLVPVKGLPTGFLRISRACFETIKDTVPEFHSKTDPFQINWEFFHRNIVGKLRIGGDIGFCHKAKEVGIQPWLMPKAYMTHVGRNEYKGSFYDRQAIYCLGMYPALREAFDDDRWQTDGLMNQVLEHWGNPLYTAPAPYIAAAVKVMSLDNITKPVLELGSGLSSLFVAMAAKKYGLKAWSLEQDRCWMGKVWGAVEDCGKDLFENFEIMHRNVDDETGHYKIDNDGLYERKYSLVLVDGPMGAGPRRSAARDQCLKFDSDYYIFDDAERPQVLEIIAKLEANGYNSEIISAVENRVVMLVGREKNGDSTGHSDEGAS